MNRVLGAVYGGMRQSLLNIYIVYPRQFNLRSILTDTSDTVFVELGAIRETVETAA